LIADKKFTQVKELLPILEAVSAQNKSLLVIAEDVEGEALATLIVNKDNTTIVDGKGNSDAITNRIEELQTQIEKSTSPYEKEKLQERLAKFIGGVAIVHVGGHTESEMREKKRSR